MKLPSRKITLINLSIVLFIAFVGGGYLNYILARKSIRNEIIHSSLPLTQENIYSEIMKDLIPPINIASMMANDSFLINWTLEGEKDPEEIRQYLDEIEKRYGFFSTFFISEKSRNYYHYNGILKQISRLDPHDIWYYRFADSEEKLDLDVDFDQAKSNDLTIFINYRLEDYDGNFLGVTGVGLEMKSFSQFLSDRQKKYNRRIYFVDPDGLIQAHSDPDVIEKISLKDKPGIGKLADTLLIQSPNPINGRYREERNQVLVTSRYMPEIDWFLIVEQNESKALSSARNGFIITLITGVLTTLAVILLMTLVLGRFEKRLSLLAVTDSLTGLANRRDFDRQIEKSIVRFNRYGLPFCLIMVDVDNFKNINDNIGHLTGDKVLIKISSILKSMTRPTDIVSRWGGDEFAVIAECNELEALMTAERIREAVMECDFSEFSPQLKQSPVTLSCGVGSFFSEMTMEELTARTDKALYQSKEMGRNRVSVFRD